MTANTLRGPHHLLDECGMHTCYDPEIDGYHGLTDRDIVGLWISASQTGFTAIRQIAQGYGHLPFGWQRQYRMRQAEQDALERAPGTTGYQAAEAALHFQARLTRSVFVPAEDLPPAPPPKCQQCSRPLSEGGKYGLCYTCHTGVEQDILPCPRCPETDEHGHRRKPNRVLPGHRLCVTCEAELSQPTKRPPKVWGKRKRK